MRMREKIVDERGSLSILSTSLFFLLVLSSFVIMNTSSGFLAKRELIQTGEALLSKAVQNLDAATYYSNGSNGSNGSNFNGSSSADSGSNYNQPAYFGQMYGMTNQSQQSSLPIDCNTAYSQFSQSILRAQLRDQPIWISAWNCDGWRVSVTLTSRIKQLLVLPIIGSQSPVDISAEIAATNRLQ